MKKAKTTTRRRKAAGAHRGGNSAGKNPQGPSPKLHRSSPRTYELTVADSDEAELVRMTAREIFEANCPGATAESYDGMEEEEVRATMLDLADRLALFEEKWRPEDVEVVADACTDFIIEMREMNQLDSAAGQRPSVHLPAARR